MAATNGRGHADASRTRHSSQARKRQADEHAKQARKKAQARREEASGAAGWVAERAGDWSLDDQDLGWMERQKYLWNPLMDYWFRMEVEGWEKLPDPPALLIGIHSGAPFVWDAWTVGVQWWRRFGSERPLHGTAHDALMAMPVLGSYFRRMGVLPAAPDSRRLSAKGMSRPHHHPDQSSCVAHVHAAIGQGHHDHQERRRRRRAPPHHPLLHRPPSYRGLRNRPEPGR